MIHARKHWVYARYSLRYFILYRTQRPKKMFISFFFVAALFLLLFLFLLYKLDALALLLLLLPAAVLIRSPFQNLSFYIALYAH